MKKKITTLFLLALGATTYAQDGPGIGIGTQIPNQAAALEIHATKKGVLIPRLTIGDLKTFGLDGEAVEGVLVYNKTAKAGSTTAPVVEEIKVGFHYWSKADGGKWQLITSQSQLDQAISEVKNEFNTAITEVNNKIDKIIDGGGTNVPGEDKSYMVVFKPETGQGANPAKGELQYLMPEKDQATGLVTYKKQNISFGELVQGAETETFIMATDAAGKYVDVVANPKDVKMYVYFGEKAVRSWTSKQENAGKVPQKEMTLADGGIKVDVVGAVSNDFSKIINDNKTTLETFISETPGGLTIDVAAKKFVVTTKVGDKVEKTDVPFLDINVLTNIKGYEDKDGKGLVARTLDSVLPTTTAAGTVVYEYLNEEGEKVYLNITADIINSVTNNDTLKKQIFKTVNEYTKIEGGGNVYYGFIAEKPQPEDKPVLFTMDADKNKNEINIAQDIIKEINNNSEVKKTINNLIKVNVSSEPAYTHHLINTKAVFKVATTAEVVGGTPEGATVVVPYNSKFSAEIATKKIDKLLSVQISQGDKLLVTNVTDVVKTANGVSFNFGVGKMYQVLPAGKYDVVVEYISTLTEDKVDTMNQ